MTLRQSGIGAICLGALVLSAAPAGAQGQIIINRGFGVIRGARGSATSVKNDKIGLHLPQGKSVNFTYNMTDGAGFRWDIQYYGTVGQGTNNAYGGGLYLQVGGASVNSNGQGWANADGDEVEIGPFSTGSVNIYRRIKVYKDQGLARWLDIFENTTDKEQSLAVRVYSNTNWTIGNQVFSRGKGQFTDKDFAFITQTQGGNAPAVMHYVCGERSKLRPTVNVQQTQLFVNYTVQVPAKGTAVLCYFESQGNSVDELTKLMKTLRPYKVMKDLSPAVRKLLINMPLSTGIGSVELTRIESADSVVTAHGDPIYGKIENESFVLDTLFGPMTLPAKQVLGMAAISGQERQFRVLLAGGQIIAGSMAAANKLKLTMPAGGDLAVPFQDIQQAAYRISTDRPEEAAFGAPIMVLRTGDRVAFDGAAIALRLKTSHGAIDVKAEDLLSITMDNPGNGIHRATFLNGSQLGGFLEPENIPLTLMLGPKLTIPRNLISEIRLAPDEKPDGTLDSVRLSNGDELFGRLATEDLTVQTDYGVVKLRPENIKSMTFSTTHLGRAAMTLWDNSTLRGQCTPQVLSFQIVPGPTLDLYIGLCVEITRSQALPPKEIRDKLQKLLGQLGAESYKDRQAASEELLKMGKGIVPILQKHLSASDPEVRQRIEDVIEKLGGGGGDKPPENPPGGIIFD